MNRIRNKYVFHFDEDVMIQSLKQFDLPTINFASACGRTNGEMYFNLADEIAINDILSPKENESDDSLKKRYAKIVKDTRDIMISFSKCSELLMADVLKDMGFIVKSN